MVILKDAKGTEVWQNDGMVGWEWGHEAASPHFILLFTFTNGEHEVSCPPPPPRLWKPTMLIGN